MKSYFSYSLIGHVSHLGGKERVCFFESFMSKPLCKQQIYTHYTISMHFLQTIKTDLFSQYQHTSLFLIQCMK